MNKIDFVFSYLKKHLVPLLSVLVLAASFTLCFILYRIDTKIIIYPSILSLILIFIMLGLDIRKEYSQCLNLKRVISLDETSIDLPASNDSIINEYQRIINELFRQKKEYIDNSTNQYDDMINYYTTWTHQIKIPIASMKLKLEDEDNETSRMLMSELNRIEAYVKMATTYLKLDSNDIDFVFKKYKLDYLIRQVIREYSNDFISKKLSLEYEEIDKEILTDEKWFCFVLEQLLSNAIKYTDQGGIKIYLDGDDLCIKDTGIGIIDSDLPRVFERGFSGFNGRKDKTSSGLGLYLVKRIVDKLNIDINIESAVNIGTEVRLTINNSKTDYE